MHGTKKSLVILLTLFLLSAILAAQKIETADGVRVVHNKKGGVWGKSPKIALTPVRTIGDINSEDENVAFYMPSDMALDAEGNIYVLDSNNHRIQKFDKDGKYLATIGRKGQGPGEFFFPAGLEIDEKGNLHVADTNQQRLIILTPDGRESKTIRLGENAGGEFVLLKNGQYLMGPGMFMMRIGASGPENAPKPRKLLKVLDSEGKAVREIGDPVEVENEMLSMSLNRTLFTADAAGNVYLAFPHQNRIEKLSPEGNLLWKADRELNYDMKVQDQGSLNRTGGRTDIRAPQINQSSSAIAADDKGRIWVVTFNRQLKNEERVQVGVNMTMSGGQRQMSRKIQGNTDLQTTDAYKIEMIGPDGVLLGEIPLTMFVDGIHIIGDRLFLFDKLRGAKLYEFKITEK